jgi:hypothetical protein
MLMPQMAGKALAQPPPLPTPAPSQSVTTQSATTRPLPTQHQWARQDVEDHADELDENGSVRHCDQGTIPMRRTTAADLERFATLEDFFAKDGDRAHTGDVFLNLGQQNGAAPSIAGHEYARERQNVTNWGAQSFINIWQPYLEVNLEHSISQIWVGVLSGSTTQTAEAGWIVGNPYDTNTRLFVYWTNDDYQNTGCHNLDCAGFVQMDHSVMLGAAYSTISSFGGTQYEIELTWAKSSPTADWWLLYNGTKWLGYYPASLYTGGMQTQASVVLYGGEVYNTELHSRHTATFMGSGEFASNWWQNAAYQRHLQYVNTNYNTIDVTPSPDVTNANCYSMISGYDGTSSWGAYEFLGGPGYFFNAANCP